MMGPRLAPVLLSALVLPGLGHMLIGRRGRGLAVMIGFCATTAYVLYRALAAGNALVRSFHELARAADPEFLSRAAALYTPLFVLCLIASIGLWLYAWADVGRRTRSS